VEIDLIDREQLEKLAAAGAMVTVPAALLLALLVRIEKLEEKIAALESNSRNSSKPPSSDRHNPSKPEKKKRRGAGKRKPGGQKGHKGKTLRQVADPDRVIVHRLGGKCGHCSASLEGSGGGGFERRQVFDLPGKIAMEVTEHRAESGTCPCCARKVGAAFPAGVAAPAQYGERVQTMVLYLHAYQLLPCERLSELFDDVFHCPLSTGTVSGFLEKAGARAEPVVEKIREKIRAGPFLHSDETGLSLSGGNYWLHTASTPQLTFLHIDKHRGESAMRAMGVLEDYDGFVIHDYLSAYYTIEGLSHALCNAHHIRDLTCVHEDHGQQWAADMIGLLLEAKKLKEREQAGGRPIGPKTLDRLQARYDAILEAGYAINPEPVRRPGQRGRLKRGKPLNLLNRFRDRDLEVMAFLVDDVPFDNNQAERDLRMMKVKQKISGCFRSLDHAAAFAKLRSIIGSARKQSINVLHIIKTTLSNPAETAALLLGT
jgi:transposase